MGGVKSRNGRTHRIERDGVASMKENTSDVHERDVSHADFLASADGGEDSLAIFRALRNRREAKEKARQIRSGR